MLEIENFNIDIKHRRNMTILKFGGTSVADASCMLNVIEIIRNTECDKVVILSACAGITDKLEHAAELAQKELNSAENIVNEIKKHHINIIEKTLVKNPQKATTELDMIIDKLSNLLRGVNMVGELMHSVKASIMSVGERLSSIIFTEICKENDVTCDLIDADNLIITNSVFLNATPLPQLYKRKVKETIDNCIKGQKKNNPTQNATIITQGFFAANTAGKTTLLGRGGSDLAASLIGTAINADEIQIWTDVDGVLSADPKVVDNPKTIHTMTFGEIKDLSFMGAKVLHPQTIAPAYEKNIPVRIRNTFNLENNGTIIKEYESEKQYYISAITAKKETSLLKLKTDLTTASTNYDTVYDHAFVASMLAMCEVKRGELAPLATEFTNDTFSILFANDPQCVRFMQDIPAENIKERIPCNTLCITGKNAATNPVKFAQTISKVCECLDDIPLYQLIQQYTTSSVLFIIGECDIDEMVRKIHSKIF